MKVTVSILQLLGKGEDFTEEIGVDWPISLLPAQGHLLHKAFLDRFNELPLNRLYTLNKVERVVWTKDKIHIYLMGVT